jgi:hypothetical protein
LMYLEPGEELHGRLAISGQLSASYGKLRPGPCMDRASIAQETPYHVPPVAAIFADG